MWKTYPYEPTYFLEEAKRLKQAVTCPVIYIGGVSTRADIDRVFEAGFDFVQVGRALLCDPAFVNNALSDKDYDSGCIHCNRCVPLIEHRMVFVVCSMILLRGLPDGKAPYTSRTPPQHTSTPS